MGQAVGHREANREEVRTWFTQHHNACRCTGYKQIVDAAMDAASLLRGEVTPESMEFQMPQTDASGAPSTRAQPRSQRSRATPTSARTRA